MPRFALVTPDYHPVTCGVGDHAMRLASEFARRGLDVRVFSRGAVEPHPDAPGVRATGVPGALPMQVAVRLARAVLAAQCTDVVLEYTAQMWGAWRFGSAATVALVHSLRRAGVRVHLFMHEPFVPFARRPDLFAAAVLQRAQLATLLASVDTVFVSTHSRVALITPLLRALGVAHVPVVIPIGPNALPVRASPVPGRARLGVFSTLALGKRFDVVLGAFDRVCTAFPHAELVLLGDPGPPGNPALASLRARIARSPGASRVSVPGRLALADVATLVASLDVYLFPMDTGANTRSGTLPLALGAGLPVVATHGRETDASLFVDGVNVAFASALTSEAFADTTLRVLRDPVLATRLGEGARELYDSRLAWGPIVDRMLAAIG